VRRSCLDEAGGFAEDVALSCDYLMWFRIALRHELDFLDCIVAEYTLSADSISADLGRSIEARIQLFSAELANTADPATRKILKRLLFNLSWSLALAALRKRAGSVTSPLRRARSTAMAVARLHVGPWTAAFAMNQIRIRRRRLFL